MLSQRTPGTIQTGGSLPGTRASAAATAVTSAGQST